MWTTREGGADSSQGRCRTSDASSVRNARGQAVKSGTPLADIISLLGEPHPATSTQAKQLEGVMDKMPAEVRANAERDETLAWGDDSNFLVVKVNDEGVAWVTAWRSR